MIQEKARQLADDSQFKASNWWLTKFLKRNSLTLRSYTGESKSVKPEIVDNFKQRIADIMIDYMGEDIFNCDETGFQYKSTRSKTYMPVGSDSHWIKKDKARLSILFTVNYSGDKLEPLFIGKSKKPRCFNNCDQSELGILYYAQSSAWMDEAIFKQYLQSWDSMLASEDTQILLLLDNFSGHFTDYDCDNIRLYYFPPNTTSELQPLDAGIISSFKQGYKQRLTKSALESIENGDLESYCQNITVLDAIKLAQIAWNDVCQQTIVNCWKHCGY